MPTLRDFCVALLAGTVSVPSTYVVVKKTTAQKTVGKPAPKTVSKRNPAPARTVAVQTPASEKPCIIDMPSIGQQPDLELVQIQDLQPTKDRPWWDSGPWVSGPWFPPGGPGGGGSVVTPPAVPQPDTWVMMVAGFGFLGLGLRRRRAKIA